MANPYTDPRYAMARLMQQKPAAPVSSNPLLQGPPPSPGAIRLGRAANNAALNNPSLRQQIEAINAGKETAKPQGIMGTVLGNPIAKVGLNALGTLAIPGRATVAAIREGADIFDSDPNTRASFSDFKKNVQDVEFGFGKAFKIDTGSKWLDRAIGFVGDVALDPLTYATFGAGTGVGKFAGYSGRLKLAKEVLKNTGDEALSTLVARQGRSALRGNPEVLERVGANKFGVYFFGKRVKVGKDGRGLRVPMSGQIGEIGEATLAKLRLAITDTRVGKYMQKVTMPKDMLNARMKLAAGATGPAEGADIVRFLDAIPKERAARAAALQAFEQEVLALIKSEEFGGLENYRGDLYRFLEKPELLDTATEAQRRGYEVWKAWFDTHASRVNDGVKSIDPEGHIKMRDNYFPRTLTDDAIRYTRGDGVHSDSLREVFMNDPFAKPGAFTPRSLIPGKKFFGEVLTDSDMNIDSLNAIAKRNGFEGDFFETDIVNAARKYIYDASDEMGIIARNQALMESGFFKRLDEMRVTELEVDDDTVAFARATLDAAKERMDNVDEEFRKSFIDLTTSVRAQAKSVADEMVTQEQGVQNISKYLYDSKERIAELGKLIEDAKTRVTAMMGDPTEIMPYSLSDDFPSVAKPILDQFDSIKDEINRYQRLIDDAYTEMSLGRLGLNGIDSRLAELEDAATRAYAAYSEARESIESAMEFSNVLQANWDSIVVGTNLGGSGGSYAILKSIKDILETSSVTSTGAARKRAEALGIKGSLAQFLKGGDSRSDAGKYFDSVFAEMSGAYTGSIQRSKVNMTQTEFLRRVNNALSDDVSLMQLREAALYAIGRDIRIHNAASFDGLPAIVQEFHTNLRRVLDEAVEVDRYRMTVGKANKLGEIDSFKERFGPTYRKARSLQRDMEEYDAFTEYLTESFVSSSARFTDEGVDVLDGPLTEDVAKDLEKAISELYFDGRTKGLPWLRDYVDNPVKTLGKAIGEEPTLNEVLQAVRIKRQQTKAAFDDGVDTIQTTAKESNLLRGKSKTEGEIQISYSEVIRRYKSVQEELGKDVFVSSRVLDRALNPEMTKIELAEKLLTYEAVSNAVVKFEAVAGIMAAHGLAPTEEMWRGILRTVSSQYGPQFKSKITESIRAREVLEGVRETFMLEMEKVRNIPDSYASPSYVFENALRQALESSDGEMIREILGPSLSNFYDPFDMQRRIKGLTSQIRTSGNELRQAEAELAGLTNKNSTQAQILQQKIGDLRSANSLYKSQKEQFVKNFVMPWAKMVDPTRRSQPGPAMEILRRQVGNAPKGDIGKLGSPLSREISERQIYRWFSDLFGSERQVSDVWDVVGGNVDSVVSDGVIKTRGSLDGIQRQYIDAMRFFDRMSDGFLDVDAFFKNPDAFQRTPSSYAAVMDGFIRQLESSLGSLPQAQNRGFGQAGITEGSGLRGLTALEAVRPAEKAVRQTARDVSLAESKAARQRQVFEAFRNPDLSAEELSELGFTKSMMSARDAVLAHNGHRATLEYAKATQDREMISFLDAVAELDFSKFTDGIVVDVNRIPIYEGSVQRANTRAYDGQIAGFQREIADLQKSLEDGRNDILRKHKTADGSWKSPESEGFASVELDGWNQRQGRRIERRISSLESQIEEVQVQSAGGTTVRTAEAGEVAPDGRIIVDYEEQPVWATMPDGSRLVFTPEEWDSLYSKPLSMVDSKNYRAKMKSLDREIRVLNREIGKQRAVIGNRAFWGRRQLQEIIDSRDALIGEMRSIQRILDTTNVAFRNSALEKVRILTTQQPGGSKLISSWIDAMTMSGARGPLSAGGRYWSDANGYSMRRVAQIEGKAASAIETLGFYRSKDPVAFTKTKPYHSMTNGGATGRRANLQEAWSQNSSYRVLLRDEELAKLAASETFADADKKTRMLSKAAREARVLADRASREFNIVERTIRDSMTGIRRAEFDAARAAKAQFEFPEEMLDFAADIEIPMRYTLNGKQYEIPSVVQMLKNPDKYLRQANKKGNFFFDLRQKGNVAMWKDMDEKARSAYTIGALKRAYDETAGDTAFVYFSLREPTVARIAELENLAAKWSEDIGVLRESTEYMRQVLKWERGLAESDIVNYSDDLLRERLDMFELGEEIKALYGADFDITADSLGRVENRLATLRSQEALFSDLAKSAPSAATAKSLLTSKKPATVERWRDVFQNWVDENRQTLSALAEADLLNSADRKVWDAWMRAQTAEARFIREQASLSAASSALDTATAGVMVEKVVKPFEKEFRKVAKEMLDASNLRMADDMNMPSFAVNRDAMTILNNLARAREGAMARELGRFMGQYTGFFKAYATLSPGFHVRNTISNTFQLFAAGASPVEMGRGLKLYRSMGEFIKNGGTYEDWLMTLPEGVRARARIAGDVTLGLGGGNVDDAFREFVDLRSGRLVDNVATRTSRNFGRRVEGSARFMLAWDSAVRGDDYVSAFNRTKRFLFDYNDPTILDETVRNIIPFWTWMSRNLPLQLVNQWANPRPYLIYEKFANNFGAGEEDVLPSYMQETGHSIKLGGAMWLHPDLPHSKVRQQVEEFGNPVRMMSYVNPGLRLPVELMGNRKTFNDAPFTGEYKPVDAKFMPFLPLLAALGQVEYTQDGKPVMTEKAQYALTSALPMLGQAERLFPSTDAGDGMALARYFGIPLRQVDSQSQDSIRLGRLMEINELANRNKKIEEAYGQ